jgi:plasmid stabilization system protein ParE
MKVILTDEALRDLDEILSFIALNYPTVGLSFEKRLRTVLRRVGNWPQSAPKVEQRLGVRQVTTDAIEILHIHHAARQSFWEPE